MGPGLGLIRVRVEVRVADRVGFKSGVRTGLRIKRDDVGVKVEELLQGKG